MIQSACQYTGSLSDEQFSTVVDVDFGESAKSHGRLMGCNPRLLRAGAVDGLPLVGDLMSLIPERDWEEMANSCAKDGGLLEKCVDAVKDQDGEPSCVSNATLSAHELIVCATYGSEHVVELSPISLYMRCGSRRSGSTLTKNYDEMIKTGALPLDTPKNKARFEHVMSHNGYGQPYPKGWEKTAALFKHAKYADVSNLQELVTCLLTGKPVIYARSGHCILAIGVLYRAGKFFLKYLNSWGKWGVALNKKFGYGVGLDSHGVARSAAYGSIAIVDVQPPPLPANLSLAV